MLIPQRYHIITRVSASLTAMSMLSKLAHQRLSVRSKQGQSIMFALGLLRKVLFIKKWSVFESLVDKKDYTNM